MEGWVYTPFGCGLKSVDSTDAAKPLIQCSGEDPIGGLVVGRLSDWGAALAGELAESQRSGWLRPVAGRLWISQKA